MRSLHRFPHHFGCGPIIFHPSLAIQQIHIQQYVDVYIHIYIYLYIYRRMHHFLSMVYRLPVVSRSLCDRRPFEAHRNPHGLQRSPWTFPGGSQKIENVSEVRVPITYKSGQISSRPHVVLPSPGNHR